MMSEKLEVSTTSQKPTAGLRQTIENATQPFSSYSFFFTINGSYKNL